MKCAACGTTEQVVCLCSACRYDQATVGFDKMYEQLRVAEADAERAEAEVKRLQALLKTMAEDASLGGEP